MRGLGFIYIVALFLLVLFGLVKEWRKGWRPKTRLKRHKPIPGIPSTSDPFWLFTSSHKTPRDKSDPETRSKER
ncbi:MAG TPA: hypothetical protein VGD49_03680 [Longimicrobiales bacterium]